MGNNVLVSICVITYNSSATVLETLESIRLQTYENIELIISDDCSTDNTLQICEQWLTENNERFVSSRLITVDENTGIPANCNRAVKYAKGEWIKIIAGDDILVHDGLENFLRHYNGKDLIVACQYKTFIVGDDGGKKYGKLEPSLFIISNFSKSAKKQFKKLLMSNFIAAPSVMINRIIFDKIGCFEETYRYFEDYPFWLKYTFNGYRISYLPVLLVYYRMSGFSVTRQKESIVNESLLLDNIRLENYLMELIPLYLKFGYIYKYVYIRLIYYILVCLLKNRPTKINLYIYKILSYLSIGNLYRKSCIVFYNLKKLFGNYK